MSKPSDLIEEYIALRDDKKLAEDKYSKWLQEHYGSRMFEIEQLLLQNLNELGVDKFASKTGTAFKKTSVSVTTADAREFRRHVIGEEAWELADWKPNKTAINELVSKGEPLPPGINYQPFITVQIRKGKL